MLSHELVELIQCLRVLGRRVVGRVLLRAGPALLGVRWWRLTAVAAHERRQDGGIVHPAIQPPQQRPHALGYNRWVATASAATTAVAVGAIRASSPRGERPHLELLASVGASLAVCLLGGARADGVLPPVAEATVLVLMVLQEVMDRPQPQRAVWARGSAGTAGTVAMSITAAITASAASIRIHLFTPFTGQSRQDISTCYFQCI